MVASATLEAKGSSSSESQQILLRYKAELPFSSNVDRDALNSEILQDLTRFAKDDRSASQDLKEVIHRSLTRYTQSLDLAQQLANLDGSSIAELEGKIESRLKDAIKDQKLDGEIKKHIAESFSESAKIKAAAKPMSRLELVALTDSLQHNISLKSILGNILRMPGMFERSPQLVTAQLKKYLQTPYLVKTLHQFIKRNDPLSFLFVFLPQQKRIAPPLSFYAVKDKFSSRVYAAFNSYSELHAATMQAQTSQASLMNDLEREIKEAALKHESALKELDEKQKVEREKLEREKQILNETIVGLNQTINGLNGSRMNMSLVVSDKDAGLKAEFSRALGPSRVTMVKALVSIRGSDSKEDNTTIDGVIFELVTSNKKTTEILTATLQADSRISGLLESNDKENDDFIEYDPKKKWQILYQLYNKGVILPQNSVYAEHCRKKYKEVGQNAAAGNAQSSSRRGSTVSQRGTGLLFGSGSKGPSRESSPEPGKQKSVDLRHG